MRVYEENVQALNRELYELRYVLIDMDTFFVARDARRITATIDSTMRKRTI